MCPWGFEQVTGTRVSDTVQNKFLDGVGMAMVDDTVDCGDAIDVSCDHKGECLCERYAFRPHDEYAVKNLCCRSSGAFWRAQHTFS